MGVRAWLKLARHLFVKPKDGRLSTKDVAILKEETKKANTHEEVRISHKFINSLSD